ncbi:MAG: AMP-dependent synthetase/ligase [Nocardioides sp.]|nr:AMP-dependent synthetase/ligase [Nocardioides sp.]
MREFATPLTVDLPRVGSLTDDVVEHARTRPETVLFSRRGPDGWGDVTAETFHDEVRAVAKGLVAAGVGEGDRVALISRTRYEWTLLDYAIWYVGAVTVPVYETSSAAQIAWILADSGAAAVVTETADHRARVSQVRGELPDLAQLWTLEDRAIEVLGALGADIDDEVLDARRETVTPLSLATLIYTSGTTGRPKGCRITHGNLQVELGVAIHELAALFGTGAEGEDAGDAPADPSTLLFLPLAHVFARIIQVGCVKAGVRLGHSGDITQLMPDLAEFRPTFLLAVPRVFEKVFNGASQRAAADGRGTVFDRAAETAIAWSRAQDAGRVGVRLRAQHALFERLVYRKLRAALGGSCDHAISGGAPLGERLGHFFRGIGLTVLEGYGLTETTGALTVNLPGAQRIGTVGRPLPGTAVKVAEDGELLFRGGQVFDGYWNDEEATREVLDADGWFRTGDVGEVDDEGFVRITGRKKEILVTAGGKNVAPAVLEDRVRAHPLVSQCLVVGDGRPFVAALVTLDPDALTAWAAQHDRKGGPRELAGDPDVQAAISQAVDDANKAVSQAESIRRFRVLSEDWTEEAGHLTPSLKLKRTTVCQDYDDDIEALYT